MLALFVGVAARAALVSRSRRASGSAGRAGSAASRRLARQNAMRNPERTAATAAALMIGLALVTMVAMLGKGLLASDRDSLEQQVPADYVVTSENGFDSFSARGGRAAAAAPGVEASSVRSDRAQVAATRCDVDGIDPATIAARLPLRLERGLRRALAALGLDGAIVRQTASPTSTGCGSADRFTVLTPGRQEPRRSSCAGSTTRRSSASSTRCSVDRSHSGLRLQPSSGRRTPTRS